MKEFTSEYYVTDSETKATLGKRLEAIMKEKGLSQKKLAQLTETEDEYGNRYQRVTRPTIANYLKGKGNPNPQKLAVLCEVLKVDMDHLTGKVERPTHDLQFICDQTGLSVEAVRTLQRYAAEVDTSEMTGFDSDALQEFKFGIMKVNKTYLNIISQICCNRSFLEILSHFLTDLNQFYNAAIFSEADGLIARTEPEKDSLTTNTHWQFDDSKKNITHKDDKITAVLVNSNVITPETIKSSLMVQLQKCIEKMFSV